MIYAVVRDDVVENVIVADEEQAEELSVALGCELVNARPWGLEIGDLRTERGWTRNAGGEQMLLPELEPEQYDSYAVAERRAIEAEERAAFAQERVSEAEAKVSAAEARAVEAEARAMAAQERIDRALKLMDEQGTAAFQTAMLAARTALTEGAVTRADKG